MKPNSIKHKLALWLANGLRKLTDSTYKFLEGRLSPERIKKIDSYKPLPFCSLYINLRQPIPEHFIGHAVYSISQDGFRFRNDDGSESGATWKAAENVNWEPTTGTTQAFRLRMMCQEYGGSTGTSSFLLQYSQDGGAWTTVTTSTSPVRIRATSFVADGAATTNQLGGTGTFDSAPFRETNTSSSVNHSASGHSEHEWSLELLSAFTGGTIEFRLYRTESSAPPSSITVVPSLFAPIGINSIEDLDDIRNNTNGSGRIIGNYKLLRDLDFNDDASYDNPANKSTYTTGAGWVSLGSTGNPWFGANFDGDGHTISNLMCNASTTGVSNAGLFGVTDSSIIENLGLIDPLINANATSTNFNQCGAIVMGYDTEGTNILRNCFVRGGVVVGGSGSGNNGTGGMVGIAHRYSTGNLSIQDCYVEGTVVYRNGTPSAGNGVGGLIGTFNQISGSTPFTVVDSYAAATSVNGDSTTARGGLIGSDAISTTYTTSYYDSTLTPYAGGGGTGQATTWLQTYSNLSSNWSIANTYASLTTETWWINSGDYPRLYYEVPSGPAPFTKTHTTDANKKKANETYHTTSSVKKATSTRSHTTDSYLAIPDTSYSRTAAVSLPSADPDTFTQYSSQDYTDVASIDGTYVSSAGQDYLVHQFKNKNNNNTDDIEVTWRGRTLLAPSSSTVYLQIYNRTNETWDTIDSESSVGSGVDFTLSATIDTDVADYYDYHYRISCRVWQLV